MSDCVPCRENDCTVPGDLTQYGLQGNTNSTPNPVDPPRPYGNQAVYYSPCSEGQNISVDVDLPGWITIDTENQRLVGAANIFHGTSPDNANETAQIALDAFGEAHASCNQCAPAAADKVLGITITQGDALAHCESNDTLFVVSSNTDDVAIINIAAQTVSFTTIPGALQILSVVYSPEEDKIYALFIGAGNLEIQTINPDGSMGASYTTGLDWLSGRMAYDATNNRLAVAGGFAGTGDNVEIVDCATLTQAFIGDMGANVFGITYCATNDTYYIASNTVAGNLFKLTASGFAQSTSSYGIRASSNQNIFFVEGPDVIVVRNAAGRAAFVDPASDTELANVGISSTVNGACFNPCTNEVQVAMNSTGLGCYDADTLAQNRLLTIGGNFINGAAWIQSLNQTYTVERQDKDAYAVS